MKKIFFLLVLFLLGACGPTVIEEDTINNNTSTPNENIAITPSPNTGYPSAPQIIQSYPPKQQIIESYPVPIIVDESKRFTISEPLKAGDTEIFGTGLANTPIKVISISFVGEVLGNGVVNSDGTFQISIAQPLEANHVIGIQLGEQSLEASFVDGPDYTNIPMIGLVLTQAIVEP